MTYVIVLLPHLLTYYRRLITSQADVGLHPEQVVNACPFCCAQGAGVFVAKVLCAKLLANPTGAFRRERQRPQARRPGRQPFSRQARELHGVRGVRQRNVLLGAMQRLPLLLRADPRYL